MVYYPPCFQKERLFGCVARTVMTEFLLDFQIEAGTTWHT
jgi:hypothetical protein